MDQKSFIKSLRSWQNGSISRREFLGRTGLGLAAAVVASNMPGLLTSNAYAGEQGALGDRLALATWPNYHSQENLDAFGKTTGARVRAASCTASATRNVASASRPLQTGASRPSATARRWRNCSRYGSPVCGALRWDMSSSCQPRRPANRQISSRGKVSEASVPQMNSESTGCCT